MKLSSPDFENEGIIPKDFTCDGANTPPTLNIEDIPPETKSLALISDDPDAPSGTWVHWVAWNIPVGSSVNPGVEGKTDFGRTGYGGPCPPSGTHRYFFKIYALDIELDLPTTATKADLEAAMEGHILDKSELIGTYSRP